MLSSKIWKEKDTKPQKKKKSGALGREIYSLQFPAK